MGQQKPASLFRTKDIDLVTFLRFEGFKALGLPEEDSFGIRWVSFQDTPELREAICGFLAGSREASLLQEFRRTRRFILDSTVKKE